MNFVDFGSKSSEKTTGPIRFEALNYLYFRSMGGGFDWVWKSTPNLTTESPIFAKVASFIKTQG